MNHQFPRSHALCRQIYEANSETAWDQLSPILTKYANTLPRPTPQTENPTPADTLSPAAGQNPAPAVAITAREPSQPAAPNHTPAAANPPAAKLQPGDAFLITYADSIVDPIAPPTAAAETSADLQKAGNPATGPKAVGTPSQLRKTPLATLSDFIAGPAANCFSYVHLLPFFPWSSDDGFSVIDYRSVAKNNGSWQDVAELGRHCRLAFDLVLNHVSAQSKWFQDYLAGDPRYENWFIAKPADYDYSQVVRPRTHPLLSPFFRADGSSAHIWTTFSADQIDLNFENPEVLATMLDIFLGYISRGARIIRLDAIAYLWKEDGHSCLHHPKTHAVVQLFRTAVDELGADCIILTETNVPHPENISYFGNGQNEAHMVYNFALPPLVLHAFTSGNASDLSTWAAKLTAPAGGSYLNFLASHDGVGLTPIRGLADEAEFAETLRKQQARGALISYKASAAGPIPYELNVSWFDAVSDHSLPLALRVQAHLASYTIACVLDGLPAVYIHSLLGTANWSEGPKLRGYNRAINRRQLTMPELHSALADPESAPARCLSGFRQLLAARAAEAALAPGQASEVLQLHPAVFSILRGNPPAGPTQNTDTPHQASPESPTQLLCLVNVSAASVKLTLPPEVQLVGPASHLIAGTKAAQPEAELTLQAYEVLWLPVIKAV
ncbi:MAG: sugar phosphorylase [Spirochaetes bacterium]|nr:sugar phosphorylase [Spirochaetota bacterium]MBU0954140.1 sugar phosphorylase [Spirochaetota bacterium]